MKKMKKYIYCALIALLCIACSKDEDPSMDTPFDIPQTLHAQTPIFESRAAIEDQPVSWDDTETVDSRTYAVIDPNNSSEYFQYWSDGDAISLFFTTANLKYTLQNYEENNDVGIFELGGDNIQGMPMFNSSNYYAVYPYKTDTKIDFNGTITFNFPQTQYYNGNSYANGANGMLAIEPMNATDNIYEFKNFCSYLKLQLQKPSNKETPSVVKQIVLTSRNDGNPLAGVGTIYTMYNMPFVMFTTNDKTNTITLDCGNGVKLKSDTPSDFWFVLPAIFNNGEISNQLLGGFDIKVIFEDGTIYKRSTTKNISIARNHIKPMACLVTEIQELKGTIIYKYKDPSTNTSPLNFINNEGDINFADADGNLLRYEQTYNKETQEWCVTFPDGDLMNIGNNVFDFNRTEDLDYIIVNNKAGINIKDHAFYNCTAESIEFYNNVNKVEHDAFGASDIKNVQFNGNVTTIGEFAFLGSKVENVEIKGSVQTVEGSAFIQCHNLKTATLNGVQDIGAYAFKYCENLSSIEIVTNDNTVLTMGEGVFADCTSLTTVTLNAKIPPIFIHDNSESDGPYIFPSQTLIYVPTINDYQKSDYKYPNNGSQKNWWPRYYLSQLRAMPTQQ